MPHVAGNYGVERQTVVTLTTRRIPQLTLADITKHLHIGKAVLFTPAKTGNIFVLIVVNGELKVLH